MATIAISYRRADSSHVAARIRERLAERYGKDNIFMDIHDIPIGASFPDHVRKVWSVTDIALALIGRNWLRRVTWPALGLRYLALPAFVLVMAHHVISNEFDLNPAYLIIVSFITPLVFGIVFYWESQAAPIMAIGFGLSLGVGAVFGMNLSTGLNYGQYGLSSALEWLEAIKYVVIVALGFIAGSLLGRWPRMRSWQPGKEDWVRVEIETALQTGIRLVPVLLDGAVLPAPERLPLEIREIAYCNAAQVRSGLDFDVDMDRLVAGIDKILAKQASPE
jgi:hypothetical protein